jgi:hypothetical protein
MRPQEHRSSHMHHLRGGYGMGYGRWYFSGSPTKWNRSNIRTLVHQVVFITHGGVFAAELDCLIREWDGKGIGMHQNNQDTNPFMMECVFDLFLASRHSPKTQMYKMECSTNATKQPPGWIFSSDTTTCQISAILLKPLNHEGTFFLQGERVSCCCG